MSHIICKELSLAFPIYDIDSRSLKKGLINIATGGLISNETNGQVRINALHNISFHLKKGDRLGLIGHNGAGKSTLLRVLSGVYEPQQGHVHVEGRVSSLINIQVGMQPTLTGYENIKMRGLILGLSKSEIQDVTKNVEDFIDLGNFLSMPVKTYSAGMLIRLAFALSTALEPDILLVDEIIGAGDANFMEKAKNRMNHYVDRSNIMVIASHTDNIIEQFCTHVLWLEHGHIKMFGELEPVMQAYKEALNPVPA